MTSNFVDAARVLFAAALIAAPSIAAAQSAPSPDASSAPAAASALFTDVPAADWAYDAVRQLAQDGVLKGYPDGTYRGNRPLTRYEVAVIVQRTEDALRLQLAGGGTVQRRDDEALERLQNAFGPELAALQKDVATLKQQTAANTAQIQATSAQVAAIAAQQRKFNFGATWFVRAGSLNNVIGGVNGPTKLTTAAGVVAPGAALPAGLGPTSTGIGVGALTAGPNTYVTGNYDHGTGWQEILPIFSGQLNDRVSYYLRLEARQYFDANNFLNNSLPVFCTSTTPPAVGGCGEQDYGSTSIAFRFNKGFFSYTSPGGIYVRTGRYQQDEGRFNLLQAVTGGYSNGAVLGYLSPNWDWQAGYGVGDSTLGNYELNGAVVNGWAPEAQQNLYVRGEYNWSKQTAFGAGYDADLGTEGSYWNPAAHLCQNAAGTTTAASFTPCSGTTPLAITAAAGAPVTGAYQTAEPAIRTGTIWAVHYFGQNRDLKVTAEGTHRFGHDPFTGQSWIGANGFDAALDIGDFNDPTHPAHTNGNYAELAYVNNQFNAVSPDTAYQGASPYTSFYLSSFGAYEIGWLSLEHNLAPNARVGLVYEHLGLESGVSIPLGSPTCPGCSIRTNSQNALFLEGLLSF